jgi:hypothetical protein
MIHRGSVAAAVRTERCELTTRSPSAHRVPNALRPEREIGLRTRLAASRLLERDGVLDSRHGEMLLMQPATSLSCAVAAHAPRPHPHQ